MRIAFITHLFPPGVGGMQRWNLEMARAYKEAGHSVDVYHFRIGREKFTEKSFCYIPLYIWPKSVSSECPRLKNSLRALTRILVSFFRILPSLFKYDIWQINFCEPVLLRLLVVSVSVITGKKIIISTGCTIYNHPYKPGLLRFLKLSIASLMLKFPKLIFVDGNDLFSELTRNGVNKSKIKICYAGVDVNFFSTDRKTDDINTVIKKDNFRKYKPLILYCSRFSEENAPFDFIKTVQNMSGVQALMCGDGNLREDIEKYALSHNLDVVFPGSISYEKLPYIFTSSAVCLYTFSEKIGGISQVIPLSMACGAVVVTTDIGDNREIISDSYNGYIVPSGDIESMKKTVQNLLMDDSKRHEIGVNARNTIVNGWSIEKRRAEYKTLLENFKQ